MQISTLSRLKHCLQSHIESTSRNEFKRRFSHFIYSRWRRRKQRSATKTKGELRSILRLRWTALNTNWCKKMRIYNAVLKLARFIHIIPRKHVLNSRQLAAKRENFGIFGGGLKLQGITKTFHRHISGKNYWLLPGI